MGLPDGPVPKSLIPAIQSGNETAEWISASSEDLNTSVTSNAFRLGAAVESGMATAIDFLTGIVGGTEETRMSKALKRTSKYQLEQAAEVATKGFTEYWTSDLGEDDRFKPEFPGDVPEGVVKEVKGSYLDAIMDMLGMGESSETRMVNGTPMTDAEVLAAARAQLDEAANARIDAGTNIIEQSREGFKPEFPGDVPDNLDFDLPVPPKDLGLIDTLSVSTEADLKDAITKRIGEMPPDYKVQVVNTVAALNEALKAFETSANISIENAIDAVTVENIDAAINNMAVRMFDTIADYDYETLEERIINQNEVPSASANRAAALSANRAAAFAKLQKQFSELAFFPKGVPGKIDLGPTMGEVSSNWLHRTDDKINSAIVSAAKSLLAKVGIGKPSNDKEFNDALKAETQPEPLVTRPKRTEQPKEMTASDKARLKRAQKANELSGDSGLLNMLVEKYGSVIVQKEMGL
jgi:hypothetical protein